MTTYSEKVMSGIVLLELVKIEVKKQAQQYLIMITG